MNHGDLLARPALTRQGRRAGHLLPTNEVPAAARAGTESEATPLEAGARALFEPRFRHDFSRIRVHTDARAAASAAALGARA